MLGKDAHEQQMRDELRRIASSCVRFVDLWCEKLRTLIAVVVDVLLCDAVGVEIQPRHREMPLVVLMQ